MKTLAEVQEWVEAVALRFGDPSEKVCQIFVRFVAGRAEIGDELVATYEANGAIVLPHLGWLPVPIAEAGPRIDADGVMVEYGLNKIDDGIWALSPSLNVPGVIHAFVTLYDVPSPAPWESRIVVVQSIGRI